MKILKECAMKLINYEKKEMIPITYEKISLIKSKKHAIYAKESFVWTMMMKIIKTEKRL